MQVRTIQCSDRMILSCQCGERVILIGLAVLSELALYMVGLL